MRKSNKSPKHTLTVSREALLDESGDQRFRKMVHDLLAYSARIEGARSEYAKIIGLTGIEYTMLIAMLHLSENQPVYVNTLADHLHMSGAFVTIQTNSLAKKGLLKKKRDTKDARRVELEGTKKARDLLTKLAPIQTQVNDTVFDSLSRRDFERLITILDKLVLDADKAVGLVKYLSGSTSIAV